MDSDIPVWALDEDSHLGQEPLGVCKQNIKEGDSEKIKNQNCGEQEETSIVETKVKTGKGEQRRRHMNHLNHTKANDCGKCNSEKLRMEGGQAL